MNGKFEKCALVWSRSQQLFPPNSKSRNIEMFRCFDVETLQFSIFILKAIAISNFLINLNKIKNLPMGATKTKQYSYDAIELARIANALGHPARITILQHLRENPNLRNVDFQGILGLSNSSVHNHLKRLNSVKLINYNYSPHEYHLHLIIENLEELNGFLEK